MVLKFIPEIGLHRGCKRFAGFKRENYTLNSKTSGCALFHAYQAEKGNICSRTLGNGSDRKQGRCQDRDCRGVTRSLLGFEQPLPDFTDCQSGGQEGNILSQTDFTEPGHPFMERRVSREKCKNSFSRKRGNDKKVSGLPLSPEWNSFAEGR